MERGYVRVRWLHAPETGHKWEGPVSAMKEDALHGEEQETIATGLALLSSEQGREVCGDLSRKIFSANLVDW